MLELWGLRGRRHPLGFTLYERGNDFWTGLTIASDLTEGFGLCAELPRAVSVFGSGKPKEDSDDYRYARSLGAALAEAGWSVMTGGGPGVVEAACRGATDAGGLAVGVAVEDIYAAEPVWINDYVNLALKVKSFHVAKMLYVKYAQAFVVMPGGFGTLAEVFELITLLSVHRINAFPLILCGPASVWQGLLTWLLEQDPALTGYVTRADLLDHVRLLETVEEVVEAVTAVERPRAERDSETAVNLLQLLETASAEVGDPFQAWPLDTTAWSAGTGAASVSPEPRLAVTRVDEEAPACCHVVEPVAVSGAVTAAVHHVRCRLLGYARSLPARSEPHAIAPYAVGLEDC